MHNLEDDLKFNANSPARNFYAIKEELEALRARVRYMEQLVMELSARAVDYRTQATTYKRM